jgi:N6-adenosine-specific RNA methylase IME4
MKFKAVAIDPPWTYETWSGPDLPTRQASAVGATLYPIMTDDRLYTLPVYNILEDDAAVFMWATMPKLDIAIALGKVWGLTYKTVAFTWAKLNPSYAGVWFTQPMNTDVWKMGLGYWTRANCELVLLFTQGTPKRIAMDVPQLVVSPINGHSQKPEEVQNRIERLVSGPYCELFARRMRPGWTCLGNEIDGLDIFDAIEKVANEVTE